MSHTTPQLTLYSAALELNLELRSNFTQPPPPHRQVAFGTNEDSVMYVYKMWQNLVSQAVAILRQDHDDDLAIQWARGVQHLDRVLDQLCVPNGILPSGVVGDDA